MPEPSLIVEGLSKKYCLDLRRSLWYGVKDLTAELAAQSRSRTVLRKSEFWALKDVTFQVFPGETLGIVGHNGAGKSTLLKLINGLIRPDTGSIKVRGRVGALIALGTGFNPLLSGRENIYINAAVLGVSRKEVERRLDEIIDFSGVGDFIDAPVQSYSSGMVVRLGFSVAATLDPEVLLIDEVLSVGDAAFREKCYRRLSDYRAKGGTVLFISHNTGAVETISDRVMFLDHGRVVEIGKPSTVVEHYENRMLELGRQQSGSKPSPMSGPVQLTDVACYSTDGKRRDQFDYAEPFEVRVGYTAEQPLTSPYFVVGLQKVGSGGHYLAYASMLWDGCQTGKIPMRGTVRCLLKAPELTPGNYVIEVGVQATATDQLGEKWHAKPREVGSMTVTTGNVKDLLPGAPSDRLVALPCPPTQHSWKVEGRAL